MKPYNQDAAEIMARGKAAYRKKQTARRTLLGTVAGVLAFAVAIGIWKQAAPKIKNTNQTSTTVAPGEGITEMQPEIATEALTEIISQGEDVTTAAPAEPGAYTLPESTTGSETQTSAPHMQEDPNEAAATDIVETATVPQWTEAPCYMQYPSLEYEGRSYQTTGVPIDPALVGAKLGEAVVSGYDEYAQEGHAGSAAVYRIGNISVECAVCTKLWGDEAYAYVNAYYTPETLGQLIADLDLKNTLSFRAGYAMQRTADGNMIFTKYADFDDTFLWNGLLSEESLPNEPDRAYSADRVSFRADVPALGYVNKSLWITEDGCIVTNLLESAKVFYIGPAAADAFISQLRNTVPYETQENATFAPETEVLE